MPIWLDTSTTAQNDGASSITVAHTCSGSNRLLVVGVAIEDNTATADMPITGITYNGVALTKIRDDQAYWVTENQRTELWYLIAPDTGTNNVVVSFTGVVDGCIVHVISLNGAHQSSQPDANNGANNTAGTTAASTSITTVTNSSLVLDIIAGSSSGTALTVVSPQTELQNTTNTGQIRAATGMRVVSTAGATTMGWTFASQRYAHSVASFAPAAESGLPTTTENLDITSRGLPTEYTYNTASTWGIDTGLLDIPSRGLPTTYIYTTAALPGGGGGGSTSKNLLILGVG